MIAIKTVSDLDKKECEKHGNNSGKKIKKESNHKKI
jgi:hypothetical protein